MEPIIAQDIVRRYHNGHGINGVSLSVDTGRCLGVLGANGSGKTTLTRLIAGLDRIESGQLSILGAPAYNRPPDLRRRCGVALDMPAHWDAISGRQNLWFFARQYGLKRSGLKTRIDELLAEAELLQQADEPISAYSMGMRRKLNIIEALIHDPDMLILDEPSAGVDVAFLDRLVNWGHRRSDRGKTTWIADNDPDWLARAATDAILLEEGRVTAIGTVSQLLASVNATNRIDILLDRPGFSTRPTIDGIEMFRCEENRITADVRGNPELTGELVNWITANGRYIRSMEIHSITLYEALLRQAKLKGEKT